jgi:hypothetical protein
VLAFVLVSTYRIYVRQAVEIRWRTWLTEHLLDDWISPHACSQMEAVRADADNPDQRIAEDVRSYVASALGLALSLLAAVATLVGAHVANREDARAARLECRVSVPGLRARPHEALVVERHVGRRQSSGVRVAFSGYVQMRMRACRDPAITLLHRRLLELFGVRSDGFTNVTKESSWAREYRSLREFVPLPTSRSRSS